MGNQDSSPKSKGNRTKNIIIFTIILAVIVGIPFLFLNYQSVERLRLGFGLGKILWYTVILMNLHQLLISIMLD